MRDWYGAILGPSPRSTSEGSGEGFGVGSLALGVWLQRSVGGLPRRARRSPEASTIEEVVDSVGSVPEPRLPAVRRRPSICHPGARLMLVQEQRQNLLTSLGASGETRLLSWSEPGGTKSENG